MNHVLQLKGQFQQKAYDGTFGAANLPKDKAVNVQHLIELKGQLEEILSFWQKDKTINGALVSVYYYHIVAKSNRLRGLLCKGGRDSNSSIRGSRFYGDNPIQHVFTHYVKLDILEESIRRLAACIDIMQQDYCGRISYEDIQDINKKAVPYQWDNKIPKSNFVNSIVDAYYVEKFQLDRDASIDDVNTIVTIYKTDIKIKDLFDKIGIKTVEGKVLDDTTIRLDPDELKQLRLQAPYLIAMKTHDIVQMPPVEVSRQYTEGRVSIPDPGQEPIVGVIDTLFDKTVYFSEWVSYTNMVDENISISGEDYFHGTAVTSLIVDGPTINPELDDGCGRFRVKHFGVATAGRFSSFSILKSIREIIAKNRDIKVWNLSLGSVLEINRNFISPEGAELDKLQSEYDIVFVVSGTNKPNNISASQRMLLGAPADSLNSVVVNSVDARGKAASYHRAGPVLSFFNKPDVSYYGGDKNAEIKVCSPWGEETVCGTSFAAPWITRKMAYLIYIMGLTREVAKALLIDAAAGWERKDDSTHSIGYGVVPKRIEEIVQTADDEIRFIMTGTAEAYETYTYNIPIPIYEEKQPFFARATLCYFPKCSRDQGVDYTSTEMDIHFGRVRETTAGKTEIVAINANKQGDEGFNLIREEKARSLYRKWDNIKLVNDVIKRRSKARKTYGAGLWGLHIRTKERLSTPNGRGLQFGVVVTLKEMNGKNRIDDFIRLCLFRGWIVNQIDIENRIDLYNKAEEEIDWE